MKSKKNENGAISIFVILSMMFFLVSIIGVYTMVSNRSKTQFSTLTEIQSIYSKNADEIYDSKFANPSEEIPIYNSEQFLKIGSGDYVEINNRIYYFGDVEDYNYVLKNDIVIELSYINDVFDKFNICIDEFNDSIFDISYYYNNENVDEKYWKIASYKNTGDEIDYSIINSLKGNSKLYNILINNYDSDEVEIMKSLFNNSSEEEIGDKVEGSDKYCIFYQPSSNLTVAERNRLSNRVQENVTSDLLKDANVKAIIENRKNSEISYAVIPEGFYYKEGAPDTGMVITDDSENEWVWVPVNSSIGNDMMIKDLGETQSNWQVLSGVSNKTRRYSLIYEFTNLTEKNKLNESMNKPSTEEYREPDILTDSTTGEESNYTSIKSKYTNNEYCISQDIAVNQYIKDYNDLIESIERYKGFYVGRYELTGEKENPTEKKGSVLDSQNNSLNWYDYYNICTNFSTDHVESTMIWKVQWDEIMAWLQKSGYNVTSSINDSIQGSIGWGNYSHSEFTYKDSEENENLKAKDQAIGIPTGSTEYTKANNIYDLAGNYKEWSQLAYSTNSRCFLGGDYTMTESDKEYCSYYVKSNDNIKTSYTATTSRPTLYIKIISE